MKTFLNFIKIEVFLGLKRKVPSLLYVLLLGVAMILGVGTNQLDVTLIVSKNYSEQENRGLFGVHNGDPSDDLKSPDGTVLAANTSTLAQIHEYGEKC